MANYYSGDRTENMPQASWPKPGINAVGEYQVSGQPFLLQYAPPIQGPDGEGAASDIFADDKIIDDLSATVHFPAITKRITIENKTNGNLYVYFCSALVPSVALAAAADLDGDDNPMTGNPTARGNRITIAELGEYNGVKDNRPDSAVKVNKHYFTIPTTETLDLDVKCRKVFIVQATGGNQAVCQVTAELTSIEEGYDCDYRGIPGISGGVRGTMFLKSQGA